MTEKEFDLLCIYSDAALKLARAATKLSEANLAPRAMYSALHNDLDAANRIDELSSISVQRFPEQQHLNIRATTVQS